LESRGGQTPKDKSDNKLERVLKETLERHSSAEEALSSKEREALLNVTRRVGCASGDFAAAATELVSEILHVRMGRLKIEKTIWIAMCGRIADTLLDAPLTRDRLSALWVKLCEEAA
jgi:hypothetical protein